MVLFSHHVVNNNLVLPGVGYVEMAFSAEQGNSSAAVSAIAFLSPCKLPQPDQRTPEQCALRLTRQHAGAFIIASQGEMGPRIESSFSTCCVGTIAEGARVWAGTATAARIWSRRYLATLGAAYALAERSIKPRRDVQ